jgi:hypothetical protein
MRKRVLKKQNDENTDGSLTEEVFPLTEFCIKKNPHHGQPFVFVPFFSVSVGGTVVLETLPCADDVEADNNSAVEGLPLEQEAELEAIIEDSEGVPYINANAVAASNNSEADSNVDFKNLVDSVIN